jgi:hypothetical protein
VSSSEPEHVAPVEADYGEPTTEMTERLVERGYYPANLAKLSDTLAKQEHVRQRAVFQERLRQGRIR